MSFKYQNPTSSVVLFGPNSVELTDNTGTNFSVSSIGGYMEVYSHSDLNFTIPNPNTGTVLYSGNTIPINYSSSVFPPNVINLNDDGISSGRRRLGMLAYVVTADTTYQYTIDDYSTLWNNAEMAGSLTNTGYGYQCLDDTVDGALFVSSWTGSTIEGVNGVTRENARWRIYNSSLSVSANTGVEITDSKLYTIYNTTLDPTLSVPATVGGISGGTTVASLTGKTFVQLFDDLLFPIALPTYTIPTISIGGISSNTYEVGVTVASPITATSIKNDAGNYTQLRVLRNSSALFTDTTLGTSSQTNVPNQFGYANPNSPNTGFTISPSPYVDTYVIPAPAGAATSTSTIYNVDGNYSAGLAKQNNKGVYDTRNPAVRLVNAPQSASVLFSSSLITYTGIYPYFWGVSNTLPTSAGIASAIAAGTTNKVLLSASGTITITFNATTQYIWFAHFGNYTNKTVWYVDALNSGSIGGGSNLFGSPTTQNVSSPSSYWSNIGYSIYISNYATTTTSTMDLKNS